MKKALAALLALSMCVGMNSVAFAAESGATGSTKVTVTVEESFEWTIPESIDMTQTSGSTYTGSDTITFSDLLLVDTNDIRVTAASASGFKIDGMSYTLTIDSNTAAEGATLNGSTYVLIDTELIATHATDGEQSDTVVFTATIE